ncbi:MAG: hypothetical protein FD546_000306 [Pelagibacterales bacterium]|nr:hypothetical protein [Pelagibacterales bacterium]
MNYLFISILCFLLIIGCQTIENKSQKVIKNENKKLSQFLQKSEKKLKISMGEPDEIVYDDNGVKFFIYTKKKYNITCERRFEIDKSEMIVGFSSKGCF